MPIIIKYVVERDGCEKMTFTSKADADAYDKLLDTADALYEVLDNSELAGEHDQKEALSMYLAENKDTLLEALGAKRKAPAKSKKSPTKNKKDSPQDDTSNKPLEDLVIEPDESAFYEEEESTSMDSDDLDTYAA